MNAQEAKSKGMESLFTDLLHPYRIFHEIRSTKPFGRAAFLSFCLSIVIFALLAPLSMAQYPDQGQIWKEYNISAYTSGVTNTSRPEQAILDAILRQTGHNVWCGATPGMLSVNSRVVRVYHTPEIQEQVL